MGYRRSKERKHRLKKLAEETSHHYNAGAWYNENKGVYERFAAGGRKYRKYLRKLSSKRVRRYKGDMQNSDYKRTFDYWWELY